MSAGQAKLSAIWLTAAMWSSIAVIIYCLNILKTKRKSFPVAYKNVSLERCKIAGNIYGRQRQESQRQLKHSKEIVAPTPPVHKQNGRNEQA